MDFNSLKKIVITGSDGLIGSNLSKHFLSQGLSVIGIDNQSRYGDISREHHTHKNFKFIINSVLDINANNLPTEIDLFIHCAYDIGGINYWNHNESELYSNNRSISLAIMSLLLNKKDSIDKIIWFSSSQVYENINIFPTPELSVDNLHPSSGYACEKLESEREIMSSPIKDKTVIVRPFNVIGKEELYIPGNQRGHVVVDLAKKIAECHGIVPITLQGRGQHTRTFTTSEDLIDAVNMLADSIQHGIYNICGNKELTIAELAAMMWRITYDTPPQIEWINKDVDRDVKRRIGNTEKLIQDTGKHLKNNLESHLKEIIKGI